MNLRQWLRSVDVKDKYLTGYEKKILESYTDFQQVLKLKLYVTRDSDGALLYDLGVKRLGDRKLFQKWFQEKQDLPFAPPSRSAIKESSKDLEKSQATVETSASSAVAGSGRPQLLMCQEENVDFSSVKKNSDAHSSEPQTPPDALAERALASATRGLEIDPSGDQELDAAIQVIQVAPELLPAPEEPSTSKSSSVGEGKE